MSRSPWRSLLYTYLSNVTLDGEVLDLGGSRKSKYVSGFKGTHHYLVANLATEAGTDYVVDLEQPFRDVESNRFNHVLAINVLEHIFNYQNVITETHRILKPNGQALFAIPFLIQVHPSPHDHWRYTGETLQKLFTNAGFTEVRVEPIGRGPATAVSQLLFPLLHFSLLRRLVTFKAKIFDGFIKMLPFATTYSKDKYPLGYVVTAKKPWM